MYKSGIPLGNGNFSFPLSFLLTISDMSFRLTALFIAAALALATGSPLEPRSQNTPHRSFRITNNCPTQINLITAGVFDGVIPVGASTERYGTPGPFYTDANGGRVDGTGSTKAFFSGDVWFIFLLLHTRLLIFVLVALYHRQGPQLLEHGDQH